MIGRGAANSSDLGLAHYAGTLTAEETGRSYQPQPFVDSLSPTAATAIVGEGQLLPFEPPVRISVVIPTHRRQALLKRCLTALAGQEYPPTQFEVIVVEDGGPYGAEQLVAAMRQECPRLRLRYLHARAAGPAAARNIGWRAARGDIVAFTDDDTVPHPCWLRTGERSLLSGADVASGRTIVPVPPRPTDYEQNVKRLEEAPFATCNAFCRRPLLERVGGFDPRFTRAWREDSDLQFALLDAGARLVRAEDAIVYHPVRPAGRLVSLRQQSNQFFDALLYRKHPRHFRAIISSCPPWRYYAATLGQITMLAGLVTRRKQLAGLSTAVWLVFVGLFCRQRLRGTVISPGHVAEMILTSLLIPPTAVYWRLRGALAFRVFFL